MQIIIGAIAYDVVETKFDIEGRCGEFDPMKCRIRIRKNLALPAKQVTLWHEIVHGILANAGYSDHNEEQIDALAYGLVQVLRDNPQLH